MNTLPRNVTDSTLPAAYQEVKTLIATLKVHEDSLTSLIQGTRSHWLEQELCRLRTQLHAANNIAMRIRQGL